MQNEFDRIFDECIDRLNEGQSIDDVLRLYSDHAEALRPLLEAVSGLYGQAAFIPSERAKAEGRQKLMQARNELGQRRSSARILLAERLFGQPKVWAPVAAILLIFLVALAVFTLVDTNDGGDFEEIAATPSTPIISPSIIPSPSTTSPSITPSTPAASPSVTPDDIVVADAGTLEIRVTDAPNYDISAVYMTINNIEVNRFSSQVEPGDNQQDTSEDAGWETVISERRSFELLELHGGIEKVLGSRQLEAGHYTQIRMDIEEVIVTVDGEDQIAKLPSDKLRMVGSFRVEEGKTTTLTLDFDAEKSVVVTGQAEVIFKPVVKLKVDEGK